ncbi:MULTISPECIES: molybdenum ABC transporter ATP-binding protein [Methylomicrobium]|uniref:Molybdenum ABC transporter, ATP-binding protein n=1 Tax=Methylomicrobium album BG8 TaxID=686340 RepID=H8GIJ2_METAL|nr:MULTISPECIES: molybdenum ABC transporter ATP-binding protein [Methylomicrobium]EIC29019.1 molybdenum ABC transporter, ATP-binding protein [Methylomicrobium album BG8]
MSQTIFTRFQLDYGAFQLDADLNLPGSGISVLFGPSGSGKTTLLRCIAGLEQPPQGFLSVNGKIWQDSERAIFLPPYQRQVGYVFQDANLFPHLTVFDNLNFGLKRVGRSFNGGDVRKTLKLLAIDRLLDRMPDRLSGGERQRVAIARALVLKPELLLMDEPMASLDFKLKQEILPFLIRLRQQLDIPVLYVTHSQEEVAQLADHLVAIDAGRVLASGPLADTLGRIDLPIAEDKHALMVWQGRVVEHDADYHLTLIGFSGAELHLPIVAAAIGDTVRVQIYASDVSISLEAPRATSILNVLPATITDIADRLNGQAIVKLEVSALPLLAHITCKSRQLLDLQVGRHVYVQIKGTSIVN